MNKNERIFNKELLTKSKEEREDYFRNYTVSHPKMKQVLKELKKEIEIGEYNVILVVGPSGVGKSRLFEETLRSVYLDLAKQLESDKSMIPITGIELPNPDLGKFNWKDFYFRVLSGLNEPLIEYKIDTQRLINPEGDYIKINPQTAPALRRSIENAFCYRKTKALLIDEAQHFFKIGTGQAIERQFNSVKSLANMANTKIVMFGTYDLNTVINLDGQLSRRVKEIHFSRYDYLNKNENKMFKSLLFTFQKLLPVKDEPNLLQFSDYIYENSIGCAGILKNWLQRCLSDAIETDESTITFGNLEKNSLKTRKLLTLAEEAINGELDFLEKEEERVKLQSLLGTKSKEEKSETKRKGNRVPGKRSPERDIVG